ncbi:DUF4349 domain-containing protein [Amycolatopsis sp. PS_44_ISF1]|uniref:DUF4349 domain-containing protein n=1 Tax=Amycolatopsis sp. PS_44_ISF1 TaxID=2974917 RepID=UPI0028DE18F3|nr:DUF4349 domain-containing protein [Amycolatopsis sp. PS_44_ISF1]MDT8909930.1 DUF4349 domain-containing protein [Amycolatopsis sp. PS_44_ISF1]
MRSRWRRSLAVAGTGLVLVLAGCGSDGDSPSSAGGGVAADPGGAAPSRGVVAPGTAKGAAGPSVARPGTTDRKLARSARLDVKTPKLDDVVGRARAIAAGAGGYTGQESTVDASATLSLAVPAEKLDGVLDQLAALGDVTRRELSAQDVTSQVVDTDARLATQRASVERIRALLAKAASISEIASLESELTEREATLDSLEQQKKALDGSVAMATVVLSVKADTVATAAGDGNGGFLGGLAGGWDAFGVFSGGLLTGLGAVLPFVVLIGLPLGLLTGWLRKRRRTRLGGGAPKPAE